METNKAYITLKVLLASKEKIVLILFKILFLIILKK